MSEMLNVVAHLASGDPVGAMRATAQQRHQSPVAQHVTPYRVDVAGDQLRSARRISKVLLIHDSVCLMIGCIPWQALRRGRCGK
jgi:hypothetical protein